jgi:WD40 repeat protein/serine/threonine protein kinase
MKPKNPGWLARLFGNSKAPDEVSHEQPVVGQPNPGVAVAGSVAHPPVWAQGQVILNEFEIERPLGEGGMGKVYLVRSRSNGQRFAVKRARFEDEPGQQKFQAALQAWIDLPAHPHWTACRFIRPLGDEVAIFAEFVDGTSLTEWIKKRKLARLDQVLDVAIQLTDALRAIHEKGLIHQDVKPGNVLLTPDRVVKVADGGLAGARARAGEQGVHVGGNDLWSRGGLTPLYCSPEQADGKPLTSATDVWSWGLTVLEMFTGGVTWQHGRAASGVLEGYLIVGREDPSLPVLPRELGDVLRKCFRHVPAERWASMAEIGEALRRVYRKTVGREYRQEAPARPSVSAVASPAASPGARASAPGPVRSEAPQPLKEPLKVGKTHEAAPVAQQAIKPQAAREPTSPPAPAVRIPEPADPAKRGPESRTPPQAQEDSVAAVWKPGDVILDLYEVQQVFTGGGMGLVYKVRHRGWNLDLAVKSPRPEYFGTEQHKQNFHREAETWVKLGLHPHVASCFYVRRLGSIPRLFAEFVPGGSLEQWVRDGRLHQGGPEEALERILDITIQFAWGLHYAHEQGLVHQDVKPANVLLTPEGVAKVTDFGLAKARAVAGEAAGPAPAAGRSILVSAGGMTPAYCSPEQAAGRPLSRATDVWSWAVSVLELFVGDVTWSSGTVAAEALEAYLEMGTGDLRVPAMPAPVAQLLRRCFQPKSEMRPRDMLEVAGTMQESYQQVTGRRYPREPARAVELLADSLNNRAVSLLDLGWREQAEQLWQEVLKVHPGHPEAVYNFGMLGWQECRLTDDSLVKALEDAHRNHPEKWEPAYALGMVHLQRGDTEQAQAILTEAQALGGGQEVTEALTQARSLPGPGARCLRTFEGHTNSVKSVCLSGDGRLALSGSSDQTVRLWETETGRCLRTFQGHTDTVTSVSLSGDSRWALSGSGDKTMRLWEVATGTSLRTFEGHTNSVHSVSLSGDGRLALSGGINQTVRLWEAETGRCLRTFQGHTGLFNSVSLSRDGRWALSGSDDKTMRLWEVGTGTSLRTFEGHTDWVLSVCLSGDGRRALSGSEDGTMRLWEVANGRCLRTFEGHTNSVQSVSLSRDGRWALSGSWDRTVRLWEVSTGRCLRTFQGHTGVVQSVSLSGDGRRALSGSVDHTVRLWELSWFPDRRSTCGALPLLSKVTDSSRSGADQEQFKLMLDSARSALARALYSETLTLLRQARQFPGRERAAAYLELWAALGWYCERVGLRRGWQVRTFEGHTNAVPSVSLSEDGRLALSGSKDKTMRLWEVETGRCLRTFQGHTDIVWSVCLSGDGRLAQSGSFDHTVRLWEVATGRCLRTFQGHTDPVTSVSLSGDGCWALSGSGDQTVRLWDAETGRCLRTFQGHTHTVASVSLSGDGRWALSGSSDNTMRLWEVATGRCLRTFQGHTGSVQSVNLSGDGRWALSGSSDNTMRLWEVATGRCLRTFQGYTSSVTSVCLSGDGRWALSGSDDRTVRLWEVSTGRCLRTLQGHTGVVTSVCLSGDGRWALSGSYDRTVRLWELNWDLVAHDAADWDEGARPYLEVFLSQQTPYAAELPRIGQPSEEALTLALTRGGKPHWTEDDFQRLLRALGWTSYGWLRPEGVRRELDRMAASWKGPPPLPGT